MSERKERTLWEKFAHFDRMLSPKQRSAFTAIDIALFGLTLYLTLFKYDLSYGISVALSFVVMFVVYSVGAVIVEYKMRHRSMNL